VEWHHVKALFKRIEGLRPHPAAWKYNENRAFHHKTAMVAEYNRSLFQLLTRQIRYSADQPNFAADQRIQNVLSIGEQWNSCRL
jgi:hypothetical protein